jgi:lipopolysaccharide export system permease protein
MLFQSSLRQELAKSFGATVVVLVTIVLTMMLIKTLGQASRGYVNPSEVSLVLGYAMLGDLHTILTMSLFIATVSTLSRIYRDNEMIIWLTGGSRLIDFVRPLLSFAWPILVLIMALSIWVWPWSYQQTQDLKDRFEKRGDLERVAPGQFQESANGQKVFFIEKDLAQDKEGKNVFMVANERDRQTITSARTGHVEKINDQRFLMLSNGQRLEISNTDRSMKLSEFEEYATRIDNDAFAKNPPIARTTPTWTLITEPTNNHLGELSWRLGMGFAAFNLMLIALALAQVNSRAAKGRHTLTALFVFIVYENMVNLGQTWIEQGRLGFFELMIPLHLGLALLAAFILWTRHIGFTWEFNTGRVMAFADLIKAQYRVKTNTNAKP